MNKDTCSDCANQNDSSICRTCERYGHMREDHFEARVKVIRPEKAGEVWKYTRTGEKYAIGVDDDGLFKVSLAIGAMTDRFLDIAHGQNDWVRLCSPVEDDSVERIEIEGVEWSTAMNINGNTFAPSAAKYGLSPFRGLVIRPKMKMILEIPKE